MKNSWQLMINSCCPTPWIMQFAAIREIHRIHVKIGHNNSGNQLQLEVITAIFFFLRTIWIYLLNSASMVIIKPTR